MFQCCTDEFDPHVQRLSSCCLYHRPPIYSFEGSHDGLSLGEHLFLFVGLFGLSILVELRHTDVQKLLNGIKIIKHPRLIRGLRCAHFHIKRSKVSELWHMRFTSNIEIRKVEKVENRHV